jgi:hypothetical protein
MKTFSYSLQNLADFFSEWEMFQIKVVEKIKTHILCSVACFRKSCHLWDSVEKYGGVRGAPSDVAIWCIRVACWISKTTRMHTSTSPGTHTHARTHTHSQICSIYCFSTATNVTGTRLSVTLYVHCLSCSILSGVAEARGGTVIQTFAVIYIIEISSCSSKDCTYRTQVSLSSKEMRASRS